MTMMSPGRAGSPEEGRRDGAPERPDVLLGIFVVACLRVTFVDVPVLAVALLEAVVLTAVFFAVAFLALALLAVVLFVGTFFASPAAVTSCSLRLRREGRRTGPVVIVLKGPSRYADLREGWRWA
jgi:hypothetical protein